MHKALATEPDSAELRAEDVVRRAAQIRAARRGPMLPLVLGLIGFSLLVGSLGRAITLRAYAVLVVFTAGAVGLTLGWLYLVSSTAPRP